MLEKAKNKKLTVVKIKLTVKFVLKTYEIFLIPRRFEIDSYQTSSVAVQVFAVKLRFPPQYS